MRDKSKLELKGFHHKVTFYPNVYMTCHKCSCYLLHYSPDDDVYFCPSCNTVQTNRVKYYQRKATRQ